MISIHLFMETFNDKENGNLDKNKILTKYTFQDIEEIFIGKNKKILLKLKSNFKKRNIYVQTFYKNTSDDEILKFKKFYDDKSHTFKKIKQSVLTWQIKNKTFKWAKSRYITHIKQIRESKYLNEKNEILLGIESLFGKFEKEKWYSKFNKKSYETQLSLIDTVVRKEFNYYVSDIIEQFGIPQQFTILRPEKYILFCKFDHNLKHVYAISDYKIIGELSESQNKNVNYNCSMKIFEIKKIN